MRISFEKLWRLWPVLVLFLMFLMLAWLATVKAQTPTPQNPCKIDVAACELQVEAKARRVAEAEKEIASLRAQLNDAGGKLATEQGNSAALASKNVEKDRTIAEGDIIIRRQADSIAALTKKIKSANGRALCEIFHIGCVK